MRVSMYVSSRLCCSRTTNFGHVYLALVTAFLLISHFALAQSIRDPDRGPPLRDLYSVEVRLRHSALNYFVVVRRSGGNDRT